MRQWQYQSNTERFLPSAPPATPISGFECIAPDTTQRKRQPVGETSLALAPGPAPTAGNPIGYEPQAPDRMRKLQTAPGLHDYTLFKPPAATAQNPLGWESVAPERMRKIPVDAGIRDWALNQPPAATVANPLGWEASAPWASRKIPVDFGAYGVFGFVPSAPPGFVAWGWDVGFPMPTKRPTSPGFLSLDLRALPQPIAPNGWDVYAPDRAKKLQTGPGQSDVALNQPSAATAQNPLGWECLWSQPIKHFTSAGAIALDLRSLPLFVAPNGWDVIAIDRMRKILANPGAFDSIFKVTVAISTGGAPIFRGGLFWSRIISGGD